MVHSGIQCFRNNLHGDGSRDFFLFEDARHVLLGLIKPCDRIRIGQIKSFEPQPHPVDERLHPPSTLGCSAAGRRSPRQRPSDPAGLRAAGGLGRLVDSLPLPIKVSINYSTAIRRSD